MVGTLENIFASDIFESRSAGTETKSVINQDAVRIIKNYIVWI